MPKQRKTHPGIQIKKQAEDLPNFQKPYLGYRRGCGMPSAHVPIESLNLTHEKSFKGFKERIYNAKKVSICTEVCQFRSERKSNGCAIHMDIMKCDRKKFMKLKFELSPVRMAPKLKGLGSYDK